MTLRPFVAPFRLGVEDTFVEAEDLKAQLGSLVTARRKSLGWTQAHLSAKAGIDRSTLAKIESGRNWPGAPVLSSILESLGLSLGGLFGAQAIPIYDLAERLAKLDDTSQEMVSALVDWVTESKTSVVVREASARYPDKVAPMNQRDPELQRAIGSLMRIWHQGSADDRDCVSIMLRKLDPGPVRSRRTEGSQEARVEGVALE